MTYMQTDRKHVIHTYIHTYLQIDRQLNGPTDGQAKRITDRQEGWTDRQTIDRQTDR